MFKHLRAHFWLLLFSLVVCSVLYPLALLVIAQTIFPWKAQGSLVDAGGKPVYKAEQAVGSRLIAQPFTGEEFFQPRPSAASYNGAVSAASNWGGSNYLLRERVARQLGPLVKYRSGPQRGQLVGPDVEAWFQKDHFQNKPGIVAQWADMHSSVAQNWVKGDKLNSDHVADWMKAHPAEVREWKKSNPDTPEPKPEDLAGPFFASFSKTHPGCFPAAVELKTPHGKTEKVIQPVREGSDIQGIFFDLWLSEHPDASLEEIPADMVMTSGSGLDPHITLQNARYQLDRVVEAWVKKTNADVADVRNTVEEILTEQQETPLHGIAGVPLVNVLSANLALKKRLEKPGGASR